MNLILSKLRKSLSKFVKSLSGKELSASLKIALPLSLTNLGYIAINATDIIMVGKLGINELAGLGLASAIYSFIYLGCMGFIEPVIPLSAQAYGANQMYLLRKIIQQGLWVANFISIPCLILLWNLETFLMLINQEAVIAKIAGIYMRSFMWCLPLSISVLALRSFLIVFKRSLWYFCIVWGAFGLNIIFNWLLIYGNLGFPKLGIAGAGVASTIVFGLMLLVLLVMMSYFRPLKILLQIWKPEWSIYAQLYQLGLPIGLQFLIMEGFLATATLLASKMGSQAIAVHTIVLNIATLAIVVSVGFMDAAAVLVGIEYGRLNLSGIRNATNNTVFLAVIWSMIVAFLFWLKPNILATLYLDPSLAENQEVLSRIPMILLIAGFWLIFESLGAVVNAALRGLSDVKISLLIILLTNWGVGLLSAFILAFIFQMGVAGIWWGLTLGVSLKTLGYIFRFKIITQSLQQKWS